MKRRVGLAIALPLTVAVGACAPSGGAAVAVQATSSTTQALDGVDVPSAQDDAGNSVTIAAAEVHLRDIRLTLPAGVACADVEASLVSAGCEDADDSDDSGGDNEDDHGAEIIVDGPFVVDLVAGTSTPTLDDVRVPAMRYDRVDLRVDESDDEVSF